MGVIKIMIVSKFNIIKILIILISVLSTSVMAFSATYTVINTNDDSNDGSLRWAINSANAHPGTDQIVFNIPGFGPHTIQPLTALPDITDSVVIDGYTQSGAMPATHKHPAVLLIELDGNIFWGDGSTSGLTIDAADCIVRGLVINRFGDVGISIGGTGGNIIEGNYLGTDVTGTIDLGNFDDGVRIWDSPGNTIGGRTPAACNVILGAPNPIQSSNNGVEILLPGAINNLIQGNYIGIDAYGKRGLGNLAYGIQIKEGAGDNTIGGNDIAGDGVIGIYLDGIVDTVSNNTIVENHIGNQNVDKNGNFSTGIRLEYSEDNIFVENTVIGSGWNGFQIRYSSKNNKFYENTSIDNPGNGFRVADSSDNEFIENISTKNGRNGFSLSDDTVNNILIENIAQRNGEFGFFDNTSGPANTYIENICKANSWGGSDPTGLCNPQP